MGLEAMLRQPCVDEGELHQFWGSFSRLEKVIVVPRLPFSSLRPGADSFQCVQLSPLSVDIEPVHGLRVISLSVDIAPSQCVQVSSLRVGTDSLFGVR